MLLVGIDSGCSKTAALLCESGGRVLSRHRGPGCALGGAPTPAQAELLRDIAVQLCRSAGVNPSDVAAWGTGLNGIDFADQFAIQHAGVAAAIGVASRHLHLVNDGIAALWGATDRPAAVLVQHGSGLTSAWRTAHGQETLFDHLDVGRVFDMRRELLVTVARMLDGRAAPSKLTDLVLAHLGIDNPAHYAERVYRGQVSATKLRDTPPLIYAAWEAGDPAATGLVNAAISDYVLLAAAIVRRVEIPMLDVVFGGGVVRYADRFWNQLAAKLRETLPDGVMRRAELPPEFDAAVMAGFHAGIEPQRLFARLVQHQRESTATSNDAIGSNAT